MPAPLAVGVDVGGTKILSGLVDPEGRILKTDRRPTPDDEAATVAAIVAAVRDVTADVGRAVPVGCGFPGLVTKSGVTRYGPNISLREYPLRDALVDALGLPDVVIENDANAATWAEFAVGAGRSIHHTMAMFTLGTGVGGGLIIAGQLHRGAHGFAGELGHMTLVVGGEPGPSGVDGELEAYASGTAVERLAREAHEAGRLRGTPLEADDPPTGSQVTDAGRDGVEVALAILAEVGRYLGIGAATMVNALDPELIVVGGGAGAAGELVLAPARASMRAHLTGPDHRPEVPVVSATLGPEAGLVGAALLALQAAGEPERVPRFTQAIRSDDRIHAAPEDVWAVLVDPVLLADMTPLVDGITVEGDRWRWRLTTISGAGFTAAPAFTTRIRVQEGRRIDFEPVPGVVERASARGHLRVEPDGSGFTEVGIDVTASVDLPLPRVMTRPVRRVMYETMKVGGSRFARNLLAHLGDPPHRGLDVHPIR